MIVTDNLFGDLLSDCAAMLTGRQHAAVGSLGAPDPETGLPRRCTSRSMVRRRISPAGIANPLAVYEFAMLLRYSFDQGAEADLLEAAVDKA